MAVLALAVAVWLWPGPRWWLNRVVTPSVASDDDADDDRPWRRRRAVPDDPFSVAAAFDLFAVCLRAGLPIAGSAAVVARTAPPSLARPLAASADLLLLGADPAHAWSELGAGDTDGRGRNDPGAERFDALATLARRSARSGSALSDGLVELADATRQEAHDDALAAAERAGVAISGPLGLCFLPAFVCLGIVPVVIGLASGVLGG